MMNMMNTTGMGVGLPLFWGIHVLSVILLFVGVILLILWAMKTLNQDQLKNWGIGLVVGGIIACLLTIGAGTAMWHSGNFEMKGNSMGMMCDGMMKKGMMGGMMDADDRMMEDDDMMSMKGMTMMLEGKTGDAFDEAFIRMMIPHHQGAIDMAELALENSGHEEMKALARDIMSAQQREIDMMKGWMESWGYNK